MGQNHLCNSERGHHGEHSCEVMKFGPVVQEEMLFKDISYLELWQPLCSMDRNFCVLLEEGIMRNNPVKLF